MKVRGSGLDYLDYLYPDPKDPLDPWLIRKDAPEWAKEAYELDKKAWEEAYREKGF